MSESEEQLIERAKHEAEAFGVLYERYVDRIYSYILYRVGDVHEAEDLTARVFFRALARIRDYRQRGVPFIAWLYRIAHNLVANWYRDTSRRRDIRLDEAVLVAEKRAGPEHLAEQNDNARALLEVVRHLPVERQQVLILKYVEGLTNAQIAQVLGRTESAVKSLYHRTLLELRDQLPPDVF